MIPVTTDIENKAAWKECLRVGGVRLPTGYYFGLSAATGDLTDNHDVLSVKLYELDLPAGQAKLSGSPEEDEDRSQISPSAAFFEPPRGNKFMNKNFFNIKGTYICIIFIYVYK